MMVDVNTYIGGYPFRHLPHPDPDVLVRVLEREEIQEAWVGHLPSAFYRDPSAGNEALVAALAPYSRMLRPVPTIRPDWPKWERALHDCAGLGAVAIRAYPPQWGMGPHDAPMLELASACGELRLPLVLTTRFEDLRQRHWMDTAGDLTGAAIRAIVRASPRVRVLVTCAGRALIEEVHWGLTPEERARLWWDISWIWGPPEDDLAHLFRTIGPHHFLYGTAWPLRLVQAPKANLELLPDDLRGSRLATVAAVVG
jgi:predicted TIM-barrel fold metal-dependent hydrolase